MFFLAKKATKVNSLEACLCRSSYLCPILRCWRPSLVVVVETCWGIEADTCKLVVIVDRCWVAIVDRCWVAIVDACWVAIVDACWVAIVDRCSNTFDTLSTGQIDDASCVHILIILSWCEGC